MESNKRSIKCKLCDKNFAQKSSLNRHIREKHLQPGLYQCKQCASRFSKKYNLDTHMKHVHSKKGNQIKCSNCTCIFPNLRTLKRHIYNENCVAASSSNADLDIVNETDAQTLAQSVLEELKQLQKEFQSSDHTDKPNTPKGTLITIKDTLYPLKHFTLIKTEMIERSDGLKYLVCDFCGKEFRKTFNYLRHRRVHTKVRPFICILCKKSFSTTSQLKTHCITHKLHEKFGLFSKLYKCPKCNETFTAMRHLDKHLCSIFSGCNVVFKCPHCSKSFNTLKTILRHNHSNIDDELETLKTILPSPLACGEELTLSKDRKKYSDCNFCGMPLEKGVLLKQHKKRHENLFLNQCSKCQGSYVTKAVLKIHTKVHFDMRKFKCHYCNKCFQSNQSCRSHMLTHLKRLLQTPGTSQDHDSLILYPTFIEDEEKCQIETNATPIIRSSKKYNVKEERSFSGKILKYKCTECEKLFPYRAWLKKHFKYKHTMDFPHQCSKCLRKFRTKQSLQNHLIVHSEIRAKITCQVCGRQYASNKSLKVHLRIHTQETPFKCDKCSKLFRTSGHLIQHRKSNHVEKI